ncbi:MAG: hypothetical protein M3P48_00515, partial [Actinomycetota bacterium]|nr:hypothetical protein [Actinomycetota bacterium]
MSSTASVPGTRRARLRPVSDAAPAPARPRLTVVPAVSEPRRAPFVLLIGVLLTSGLLLLLMLNTVLAQDAFVVTKLEKRREILTDRREALEQENAVLDSPQRLARRAAELGMVPPPANPVFISPDGRILGKPTPAAAPS